MSLECLEEHLEGLKFNYGEGQGPKINGKNTRTNYSNNNMRKD